MTSYTYEYAVPVVFPATLEEGFAALTERGALETWFAEHAEVDRAVGGDFRFWGRYTMDTIDLSTARQKLTRFDPPGTVGFSWRLLGRDSEVTWLLEPADDGIRITVRHEFEALPEVARAKALIDDLWRLHTGNLCFYLHGQRSVFRPDFSDPEPQVRHQIVINAAPDKVFAALITPEHIKHWFPAPDPVVEPRVGGKYSFGFRFEQDGQTIEAPPMQILQFEENTRLVTSWPDWRGDPSVPDQTVAWQLEDLGDGRTRLTLLHSGFVRAVDVSDYPFGWVEFLDKIKGVAEGI